MAKRRRAHKACVVVRDRIARGTAQKEFLVAPKRFTGERLEAQRRAAIDRDVVREHNLRGG